MKNFLPGPTGVRPALLDVLSRPILGHHTDDFQQLIQELTPRLQYLTQTSHTVFALTCTASAALEAALLNTAGKRILVLANGAFGERWLTAARALGLQADGLILGWGLPLPEFEIGRVLDRTNCDTLVMVHGESSTGMLNPIQAASNALKYRPEVLFILDAVATLGGVPIALQEAGIDVLVGASQKCLGLPPGIVPLAVSPKALERSKASPRKGYACDFNLWQERWENLQTVATPAIPQLRVLNEQLAYIETETLEKRWERHQKMLEMTQTWAQENGFVPFSPAEFLMPSLSCLRPLDSRPVGPIVEAVKQRGYLIGDGYGKLKGRTLRIGHMGDWQVEDVAELLDVLSEVTR